jgi:ribosomal protein S18 acetylase RimI-like enzyme
MNIRILDRNSQRDLAKVYEIFRTAYHVEAEILGIVPTQFFPLQMSRDDLEKSNDEIFVLECGGAIAGAVFLEQSGAAITISNLVVDPEHFRKGFGKALVNHVLEKYPTAEFLVGTGFKNSPAIKLYEEVGFTTIGDDVVEPNLRIIKMKRSARKQ